MSTIPAFQTRFEIVSDDHSNHNLPIGATVSFLRVEDGVNLYTQGGDGDEVAIDDRDLAELIAVTYSIDNYYEDGTQIHTVVETEVPPPPDESSDDYEEWENEHVFNHTGANYEEGGDASYFVTVTQSSNPELFEPGREFEFC